MTEKTCNSCIHFGACSKWTDFPKQCGVPVCASFAQQSEKYLIKENGDILPLTHHSEWFSVEDRLPENDYGKHWKERKYYLVMTEPSGLMRVAKFGSKEHLWWIDSHNTVMTSANYAKVTHWMPLPEPPEMKGGE